MQQKSPSRSNSTQAYIDAFLLVCFFFLSLLILVPFGGLLVIVWAFVETREFLLHRASLTNLYRIYAMPTL